MGTLSATKPRIMTMAAAIKERREEFPNRASGLGGGYLGATRLCQRTPISVSAFNPDIPLFSTGTSKPHLLTVHNQWGNN